MTYREVKKQAVSSFKDRFINFTEQKETFPNHVVNDWVTWLYDRWSLGVINLADYRKLLAIDILKV